MMTAEYESGSERDTRRIAREFAKRLSPGDVIAFSGDLGAGKTAFTRGVCEEIGCADEVCSPTFAVANVYISGRMPLYHFDFYRISTEDDLETAGYFDALARRDGIIAAEWSENIPSALPRDAFFVSIEKKEGDCRLITIKREGE